MQGKRLGLGKGMAGEWQRHSRVGWSARRKGRALKNPCRESSVERLFVRFSGRERRNS